MPPLRSTGSSIAAPAAQNAVAGSVPPTTSTKWQLPVPVPVPSGPVQAERRQGCVDSMSMTTTHWNLPLEAIHVNATHVPYTKSQANQMAGQQRHLAVATPSPTASGETTSIKAEGRFSVARAGLACMVLLAALLGVFLVIWLPSHLHSNVNSDGEANNHRQGFLAPSSTTSASPSTATVVPGTDSSNVNTCTHFHVNLKPSHDEEFSDNADSNVTGSAACMFCLNGTMHCTSELRGGETKIIAAHIHLVDEWDDAQNPGKMDEGSPVINFCGSNGPGLIADGTEYMEKCEQWDSAGVAKDSMDGTFLPHFNRGTTVSQRVAHMAANPHRYFLVFFSLGSWNHWYPRPRGMCRGELHLA